MKSGEILRYYQEEPDLLELSRGKARDDSHEYANAAEIDSARKSIPDDYRRESLPGFPELSEVEVIRHFTRLSAKNFCIDTGMYPLGSCTMKYNPKINDKIASMGEFAGIHPYHPEALSQGALEIIYLLGHYLCAVTGLDAVSVEPSAGAQGEFVGMQMIMAWHEAKGNPRKVVLIPDSAHGTNPASSALSGYSVAKVKSDERGMISPDEVKKVMNDDVAGLMVTNPNTLGIFEKNIKELTSIVHDCGGLVYCDGANLNALLGLADFKAMGVDVMHINLHKTFSTPHGGGGPGAGPVVVRDILKDFLPVPVVVKGKEGYRFSYAVKNTIGRIKPFYGNFGVIIRALAYILSLGEEGLRAVRENAVLNANYIKTELEEIYHLPYDTQSLHEVVFSDKNFREKNVTTLDIAKRMMDFGFHPPTVYFPLIVKGALMIEPTETESKPELDRFIEVMKIIAKEARENPAILHSAPNNLGIKRLDEVHAARNPVLVWGNK